jgi:hypothetical protein
MATNLPGGTVCVGRHSVCLMRVAALDTDCSPMGGADTAIVTLGVSTVTITPNVTEGRRLNPPNGCGRTAWSFIEPDRIESWGITAESMYHDPETYKLMFGGTLIVGNATSGATGKNIGWAAPHPSDAPSNGVYLEFITRNVNADAGDCLAAGGVMPYTGYILPKARLVPGDSSLTSEEVPFSFTGTAAANPNQFNGPWNDYPGTGYIPNTAFLTVDYSQAAYNAIAATASCGYKALPAAS